MTDLTQRLNQIVGKITSQDFLESNGQGGELSFYIFDYPAEKELAVRKHLTLVTDVLDKQHNTINYSHVNVFHHMLDMLEKRGYLEKAEHKQQQQGNDALGKALQGILHAKKIAQSLHDVIMPTQPDLVLLNGIGSAYPLLRTHTLLSALHPLINNIPLVLFYPGTYSGLDLSLFGRLAPHNKPDNYYRAFRLIS